MTYKGISLHQDFWNCHWNNNFVLKRAGRYLTGGLMEYLNHCGCAEELWETASQWQEFCGRKGLVCCYLLGKVREAPRLLATSKRASANLLHQGLFRRPYWSLGFPWVYPEHWEGSCWVKQSSLGLLSLPLLQAHRNGTGAAPLALVWHHSGLVLAWLPCGIRNS